MPAKTRVGRPRRLLRPGGDGRRPPRADAHRKYERGGRRNRREDPLLLRLRPRDRPRRTPRHLPWSTDVDEIYLRPHDPREAFDDVGPRAVWITPRDGEWHALRKGTWQRRTPKRRVGDRWTPVGGGDAGGAAFLHEDFEDANDKIVPENGTWVPDYDEAVEVTTDAARVGNQCLRLHMEYDWEYPDVGGMPGVKPIPNDPAWTSLHERDPPWGVWGEPFWIGFSLGLPDDWQPDGLVEQVFEFHRDLSENPGDTIQEKKEYSGSYDGKPITVRIDGTDLNFLSNWTEDLTNDYFLETAPQPLEAGNWYDIVMNIK